MCSWTVNGDDHLVELEDGKSDCVSILEDTKGQGPLGMSHSIRFATAREPFRGRSFTR